MKSRNLVSIRLLQSIGIPYAVDYLQRFGFNSSKLPAVPSLALGTASLSPLEIARGYAVFANGGFRTTPFFIVAIKDQNDKIIFRNTAKSSPDVNSPDFTNAQLITSSDSVAADKDTYVPRVITAQNAYLIYDALKDVIRHGTAISATAIHRNDLAGKTGTTNDKTDAWFSGFNADLVTTVWVGFDKLTPLYEYGAEAALPIWTAFMAESLQGVPEHSLPMPSGIVSAKIDPLTGLLALPSQSNAVGEIFVEGTVPTTTTTLDAINGYGSQENPVDVTEENHASAPREIGDDSDHAVAASLPPVINPTPAAPSPGQGSPPNQQELF